jgi:hypothetical protein
MEVLSARFFFLTIRVCLLSGPCLYSLLFTFGLSVSVPPSRRLRLMTPFSSRYQIVRTIVWVTEVGVGFLPSMETICRQVVVRDLKRFRFSFSLCLQQPTHDAG